MYTNHQRYFDIKVLSNISEYRIELNEKDDARISVKLFPSESVIELLKKFTCAMRTQFTPRRDDHRFMKLLACHRCRCIRGKWTGRPAGRGNRRLNHAHVRE